MSTQATKRLNKEYKTIQNNPIPHINVRANYENILECHYIISPPSHPYADGQFHGILRFPPEYPFKPPSIIMITPNGRFEVNTRLCLSMSDYHVDTWNPAWSVSTILIGLMSFMLGNESTTGSISTTDSIKVKLARNSKKWNNESNLKFKKIFPELYKSNQIEIEEEEKKKLQLENELNKEEPIDLSKLDPEDRIRYLELESNHGNLNFRPILLGTSGILLATIVFLLMKLKN
ncbi:unnamed protein product [Candida verbasci]|uniref:UBC core domain-containing protein n=1 Tax=Candida verbasci TaxID=1227364 RepID=A0A9W4XDG0_9ASCO|nr:unnamed protein product [Candida verbasci]